MTLSLILVSQEPVVHLFEAAVKSRFGQSNRVRLDSYDEEGLRAIVEQRSAASCRPGSVPDEALSRIWDMQPAQAMPGMLSNCYKVQSGELRREDVTRLLSRTSSPALALQLVSNQTWSMDLQTNRKWPYSPFAAVCDESRQLQAEMRRNSTT